ncbi:hypothetical protein SNA01_03995, partial [Escherichia coli]|nr:hypothetical protein [Escherichia coli]
MAGHNSRYKTLLNSSDFPSVVRRLHFTGSKLTIICSLMTTLKTCGFAPIFPDICYHLTHYKPAAADIPVASD